MNRNNMCHIKTYSIYFKALVGLFFFLYYILSQIKGTTICGGLLSGKFANNLELSGNLSFQ